MRRQGEWNGVISDLGGPTANMYQMRCEDEKYESKCRRLSCVHPDICEHLKTDHGPLIDLMKRVRKEPGVKHVHIASGVRTDLVVDGTRGAGVPRGADPAPRRRAALGGARARPDDTCA